MTLAGAGLRPVHDHRRQPTRGVQRRQRPADCARPWRRRRTRTVTIGTHDPTFSYSGGSTQSDPWNAHMSCAQRGSGPSSRRRGCRWGVQRSPTSARTAAPCRWCNERTAHPLGGAALGMAAGLLLPPHAARAGRAGRSGRPMMAPAAPAGKRRPARCHSGPLGSAGRGLGPPPRLRAAPRRLVAHRRAAVAPPRRACPARLLRSDPPAPAQDPRLRPHRGGDRERRRHRRRHARVAAAAGRPWAGSPSSGSSSSST